MPARLLPGLVSPAQPPVTRPRLCPRHVQVQRLRETAYETLTKESAEKRDADVNMITVNKDTSLLQTLDVRDGARVGEVESLKSESHTQINRISGDLKVEVVRSFAVSVHELSHLSAESAVRARLPAADGPASSFRTRPVTIRAAAGVRCTFLLDLTPSLDFTKARCGGTPTCFERGHRTPHRLVPPARDIASLQCGCVFSTPPHRTPAELRSLPRRLCEPASKRQAGLQARYGRDQSRSERQLGSAASSFWT